MAEHHDLVIIGSGPAGYTAAIYAARAMLSPVIYAGLQPGGQLTITTDVENYPGFADVIQGPWLVEQMEAQAKTMGADVRFDVITHVDLSQRPFKLSSDGGHELTAKALIIASGAKARWLGLESEQAFMGFGVSACATCDGFFYRNKEVMVIGGGNTAVEEALFLTRFARRVRLVHRRDTLRAEKVLQDRVLNHEKIELIWHHELDEVMGEDDPKKVTGVRLRHSQSGETTNYDIDGLFIAIGHAPQVDVLGGQLQLKPSGCIWTEADSTQTSVKGVFAAGDVADDRFRQAVTAAGLGCMAALEAEQFLESFVF